MERIGIFKIKTSFNVTDRGIVAVGHFIEGRASIGSWARIDLNGEAITAKIRGTEMGNPDSEGRFPFGLLLSFEEESVRKIVERDRLQEQTVYILADIK
jgi:hypothetical protein